MIRPGLIASAMVACLAVPGVAQAATAPRIVGGAPTPITAAPWQVAVIGTGDSLCGGSLIAATWVLTAAHCIVGTPRVIAGVSNLAQRSAADELPVTRVVVHPGYDPGSYANDLALIELGRPIVPGPTIGIIELPTAGEWPVVGTAATITGWGATSFGGPGGADLRSAQVQILLGPGGSCGEYGSSFDTRRSICAGVPGGGVDSCQGDSGGPLVAVDAGRPRLAGVTSIGSDCGLAAFPGIYTRVTTYLEWIRGLVPVLAAPPNPPQGVVVTTEPRTGLVVSWSAPAANGSSITAYSAAIDGTDLGCTSTSTGCTIEGARAGAPVQVRVVATNAVGSSTPSAPVEVIPVDGVATVGARVPVARLAGWARVGGRPVLRVGSPTTCRISGAAVRMRAPGLCVVRVQSNGTRGTAYVEVRPGPK